MHVFGFFYVEVEIGRAYPISRGNNLSFFISFYRKMKLHTNRQKAILLFVLKAHAPPPTRCYNKQQTILMLFIKLLYFL